MIRRAFRGAFSDDELDDIYSSAWVGTLRALAARHRELADDEIRSYVFTAVANQAGKELRRRRRKPTAPIELVGSVADSAGTPEDRAAQAEHSRVTRDLLASLPKRRRAVILLRYGWGLEPSQVRALVGGLSPRAYRKEVTRGVEEMAAKLATLERGEWCAEREPVLRAFVAGLADDEQRRQAQAHLAHCHGCSDFVARLSGHLHDLSGAVSAAAAIDGIDGQLSFGERVAELGDRARELGGNVFGRGAAGGEEVAATATGSGGLRGAGAAGAGALAKLTGLGGAGKLAVACAGSGFAATACIVAGVGPIGSAEDRGRDRGPEQRAQPTRSVDVSALPSPGTLPSQIGHEQAPPPEPAPNPNQYQPPSQEEPVEPVAEEPLAPSTPPVQQEFGVAAAAPAPAPTSSEPAGGESGGGSALEQEFGP